MEFKLPDIKKIIRNSHFTGTLTIVLIDLALLLLVAWLTFVLQDTFQVFQQEKTQKDLLSQDVALLENNKRILGSIEIYNDALDKLIPDNEGYFELISALDQLEEKSGAHINSYSIDLEQTTQEKLSLDLELASNTSSLESFLSNYRYGSGRLITIEQIDVNPYESQNATIGIHFFHKPFVLEQVESANEDVTISEDDRNVMDEIVQEMSAK
ncbi:hypothetical protein KC726_05105 [Candidatus Woesebacteria bacterium]|nr:hypothetical protein [Candidatus Woesebacteria bacterium]